MQLQLPESSYLIQFCLVAAFTPVLCPHQQTYPLPVVGPPPPSQVLLRHGSAPPKSRLSGLLHTPGCLCVSILIRKRKGGSTPSFRTLKCSQGQPHHQRLPLSCPSSFYPAASLYLPRASPDLVQGLQPQAYKPPILALHLLAVWPWICNQFSEPQFPSL